MSKYYILIIGTFILFSSFIIRVDRNVKVELKNQITEQEFQDFKTFISTKKGIVSIEHISEKKMITLTVEDKLSDAEIKQLFEYKDIETINL